MMTFEQAYEQYHGPIHGYIYRRLGSHELAEDLTQDTFEHAMRAWPTVRSDAAKSWLYRIAHNLMISYLRRVSLVAWTQLDDAGQVYGQDEIELCAEREHIESTLAVLKPKYANALRLTLDGGNLPYDELAARAGVSRDLFKHHVSRGRRLFAEAWREEQAG